MSQADHGLCAARGHPHHDNIIDLPGEPLGRYAQPPDVLRKGAGAMVTYSDLIQFVIMLCAVVTLAVMLTRKK